MKRVLKKSGFTLMELLVVVIIIGLLFSVVLPFSQERYEAYKGEIEAEKVLLFLSEKRRQAFLNGEEIEIFSKDGIIYTSENETFKIENAFIAVKEPFKFYPGGSTGGGLINFYYKRKIFQIEVKAPFGDLCLREG